MQGEFEQLLAALFKGRLQQAGKQVCVIQRRPDAVADNQQLIVQVQGAVAVIDQQMFVQAHGPLEHMVHARMLPDVVLGQLAQLAVAQQVRPAVTDMGKEITTPAQHQRGERGQQGLASAIGAQPAVVGRQQLVQRLRHRPGFRCGVVVQRQRLQRGLGSQCTVGALADAVGHRQ